MKYKVFDDKFEIANYLYDYVNDMLTKECLFCFPSGNSPKPFFTKLHELDSSKVDLMRFVSLDEWLDVDQSLNGSCLSMLQDDLFIPAKVKDENVVFFKSQANPEDEKIRIDNYIKDFGGIDLTVVGLGLNGHIGLNEPGTPILDHSEVFNLASSTKTTAEAYFNDDVDLHRGITLGLRQIAESSKKIFIIVDGAHKKDIVLKIIKDQDMSIPAAKLASHDNVEFLLAKDCFE